MRRPPHTPLAHQVVKPGRGTHRDTIHSRIRAHVASGTALTRYVARGNQLPRWKVRGRDVVNGNDVVERKAVGLDLVGGAVPIRQATRTHVQESEQESWIGEAALTWLQ